jgi:hypothetical protein
VEPQPAVPEPAVEPLTLKDYYNYTARQVKRGEALISNRLSWMLTFEGFLFAALALTANVSTDAALRSNLINYTIPAVGFVVAALTAVGIWGAYVSIKQIKRFWASLEGSNRFPLPYGNCLASFLGRITTYGIPAAMMATWGVLFILQWVRRA